MFNYYLYKDAVFSAVVVLSPLSSRSIIGWGYVEKTDENQQGI